MLRGKIRKITGFSYKEKSLGTSIQSLNLIPGLNATSNVRCDNSDFSFLNLEKSFLDTINWNDKTHGKLWTYNLNYFEFLHTSNISKEQGLNLIDDFIRQIKISKDGLEPYPISLRTIHWTKFLTYHQVNNHKINESIYNQILVLKDYLEYHILGNHLLENGFGLLFGGYFLNDEKFYKTAKQILIPELNKQILEDGAHFEISPMYHQLMLYRVLDSYNLVKKNAHFNQELLSFFKEKAELMLGWLEQMTFKNGDIPLLNDSAFNINPTTQELIEYANRLGLQPKKKELNESGYRKIIQKNYELIADIGHIGPDYIPGHAHSDTLSFVLYVKNLPFIIDTGISTYNPTERRQIERSTSSHNTVQIGDYDQSEVWSSFRVARRAYPNILQDTNEIIEADLDYATISANHKRKFQCLEGEIIIKDEVKANHLAKAYLHFHPDVQVTLNKNIVLTNLGQVMVENATKIELENYQYAPEFNKLIPAKRVIITFSKQIKTTIQI